MIKVFAICSTALHSSSPMNLLVCPVLLARRQTTPRETLSVVSQDKKLKLWQ
jgi:hypothetical protein